MVNRVQNPVKTTFWSRLKASARRHSFSPRSPLTERSHFLPPNNSSQFEGFWIPVINPFQLQPIVEVGPNIVFMSSFNVSGTKAEKTALPRQPAKKNLSQETSTIFKKATVDIIAVAAVVVLASSAILSLLSFVGLAIASISIGLCTLTVLGVLMYLGASLINPNGKEKNKTIETSDHSGKILDLRIKAKTIDGRTKYFFLTGKDPIGRGGYCSVYEGYDPEENKKVIVKVLIPSVGDNDPAAKNRLRREFEIMATINHPRIVRSLAQGMVREGNQKFSFIVLEYIESPTLYECLLKGGYFSPVEAIKIAIQIVDGMMFLNEKGIFHRDLKPGNIFYSRKNGIKIGDFGLAKSVGSDDLTKTGLIPGTIEYQSANSSQYAMMSRKARGTRDGEEQIKNLLFIRDQFAFGALLYELLTGIGVTFQGDTGNPLQIKRGDSFNAYLRDYLKYTDINISQEEKIALDRKYQLIKMLSLNELEIKFPDDIYKFLSRCVNFDARKCFPSYRDMMNALIVLEKKYKHQVVQIVDND
ncbi:MAG: serine/threonine protein kinase bacterial [Candidatus Saganbacteria bacterium]|uniref:Serine/threonine protein kinase bacterial n=1 Tax=Candidatus Saganbacteria bacterium TaxID=2575572 RepID=A0A833P3B1_UNCSA|nr:MAG: serine/threonine protein kinase bacterial [Candidatus Saganbacteria bacterium]